MSIEIIIAFFLVIAFSTLVFLLRKVKKRVNHSAEKQSTSETVKKRDCPLCGGLLDSGQMVHSEIFLGRKFDLMRIYGCPHCQPGETLSLSKTEFRERRCPYCKKVIPLDGYVMAQVYKKSGRKTHVHVYGCTSCKPGRG